MRHRDHSRFVTLVDEHKAICAKVANAYCRARDDRGDLLQEMVIQLWRSFDRFDERQRFSTWMYRVAMNVAISFHRRESRRQRDVVPLDNLGFELAAADQALDTAPADLQKLQRLIHELAPLDRALMLLYLDGHSHEDTAALMG